MEIGGGIGDAPVAVDVDDRCAKEMLGVDVGDRCCETGLDCRKADKIGEVPGVIGRDVGREDLLRVSLTR